MIKKILSIFVIFIALVSVSFSASLKLDSTSTTPSIISPGDSVDVNIRVQNILSENEDPKYSYKLEIEPTTTQSKENIIILDGEDNVGRLGANEYWNSKFKIKIKEGAPSSDYELGVTVNKYLDNSLISSIKSTITITVLGSAFFQLDSEDKIIGQGETKTFKAILKNIGGASAGNINLEFTNTNAIQVVGTNSFYFDNLDFNKQKKFNITMHAADTLASGTYNFPVSITYNDGTQIKTQTFQAGILVGGTVDLKVASVETTPKQIRPGDNFVLLSINLENAGEDAAKSISAHLTSNDIINSYSNDNQVYAGRVDSGSFSTLKFYINIPKNISSDIYNLDLNLDYKNLMGENFQKQIQVPIFIKEKPILEIKNVKASGNAGDTIQVKIDIENRGDENAEEVDIRLISDSALPFSIEERSVYIGAIQTEESKTAIFNIKVSPDADINDYNIRAFLRARGDSEVGDNNIYTYNKDVNIQVTGKALNKTAIFGFLIAILVIGGLVFRKKKINKKATK